MAEEHDLWAAVLDRAIEDLKRKKERQSALRWLKSKHNTGVGSFVWICHVLGHDTDKTREKILENDCAVAGV